MPGFFEAGNERGHVIETATGMLRKPARWQVHSTAVRETA
jgi:hypothetical protein